MAAPVDISAVFGPPPKSDPMAADGSTDEFADMARQLFPEFDDEQIDGLKELIRMATESPE